MPQSSSASVHRYVDCWLPLVAESPAQKEALIPPPDVAWLWHCHRLAPVHYECYVKKHFKRVLEPCATFAFQSDDISRNVPYKATQVLWLEHYSREPFFLATSGTEESKAGSYGNFVALIWSVLRSARLPSRGKYASHVFPILPFSRPGKPTTVVS